MSGSRQSAIPASPIRPDASVLVGVMAAPDVPAVAVPQTLERWRWLTPLATWMPIELGEPSDAGILCGVATALDRFGMAPRQLILVGEGPVAQSALELVLRGVLPCGGMVAIDISCGALPFRIVPTVTAIRLVVRHDYEQPPSKLISAVRAADLDARIINLNAVGCAAEAAASATETFVLELVATIGYRTRDGAGNP